MFAHATTTKAPFSAGIKTPAHPENKDSGLWQVSLRFEALFLQQIMSAMHKTVPHSGLLPSGFADDMYRSMLDQAIADTAGHRSSLGIARDIYRQLYRQQVQVRASTADNHLGAGELSHGDGHGTD